MSTPTLFDRPPTLIHPCAPIWNNPKAKSARAVGWRCTVKGCGFESTDGVETLDHIWRRESGTPREGQ